MTLNPDTNHHGGDADAVAKRLGLKQTPDVHLDFSVNVNPLGPPACIRSIMGTGKGIDEYPDIYAEKAVIAIAKAHETDKERILLGNGSTEIIGWIFQALKPNSPAWIPPCYAGYAEAAKAFSLEGMEITSMSEFTDSKADLLFLTSPNNPTGDLLDSDEVLTLARSNPAKWIVIDESFMDFVEDADSRSLIRNEQPKNLIVLKSLTKFFAIPGLRLGMACAHPDTAEKLRNVRLPWTVNAHAQQAALSIYEDKQYLIKSVTTVSDLRDHLRSGIDSLAGWTALPSVANYIIVKLPAGTTATELQRKLLAKGILIRSCADYPGLGEQYIRLAVRPKKETDELIAAITGEPSTIKHQPLSIMLVGTTSDAGKTVMAAGLCRHYQRKGIKVAPFKAQNMALNSFVTAEGGEMGRAQVVQAEAAGVQPHTDMNPVLLKPMGSAGSQVIVNGQPIGNFPAKEYYEMKKEMKKAAFDAYDRLASQYELIILEGAGSPAEINLMEEDFVNMAMAEHAGANVILVADIDRGGVFASIYGTIQLLPDNYRKLIKGIIINKFRGDESLLESGITQIEQLTGVPVLGIMPYLHDLSIEEEDSLGLEKRKNVTASTLDIAVIRFPRISNYTDFLVLENTHGVSVRYISDPRDMGSPDLVILPGTKNTRGDLQHIEENGLSDAVQKLASSGVPIFGICGGYQMLGSRIADQAGIEGEPGEDIGLNLLPISTVLEPKKELAQVSGYIEQPLPFLKPQTPFSGYEIHAGRSCSSVYVDQPLLITSRRDNKVCEAAGTASEDGLVFGCYIHGFFDSEPLRRQLLDWLCERKGIKPPKWTITSINDFDNLADLMKARIDLSGLDGHE